MTSVRSIGRDVLAESVSIAVRNSVGKIVMECVNETKAGCARGEHRYKVFADFEPLVLASRPRFLSEDRTYREPETFAIMLKCHIPLLRLPQRPGTLCDQ